MRHIAILVAQAQLGHDPLQSNFAMPQSTLQSKSSSSRLARGEQRTLPMCTRCHLTCSHALPSLLQGLSLHFVPGHDNHITRAFMRMMNSSHGAKKLSPTPPTAMRG